MLRFVAVILLALACSKKEDKPPPAPPPPIDAAVIVDAPVAAIDAPPPGDLPADFDFDKLKHEDKVKFMKQKVMPKMKPTFQNFDPKEFASVTCKTCHGKDPQKTKYKMPNPELPPLDFDEIKAGKKDKKMVEFMTKTVKPEMAKLLHKPEMTESEPDGFGCLHCHTMKKQKKK